MKPDAVISRFTYEITMNLQQNLRRADEYDIDIVITLLDCVCIHDALLSALRELQKNNREEKGYENHQRNRESEEIASGSGE